MVGPQAGEGVVFLSLRLHLAWTDNGSTISENRYNRQTRSLVYHGEHIRIINTAEREEETTISTTKT